MSRQKILTSILHAVQIMLTSGKIRAALEGFRREKPNPGLSRPKGMQPAIARGCGALVAGRSSVFAARLPAHGAAVLPARFR